MPSLSRMTLTATRPAPSRKRNPDGGSPPPASAALASAKAVPTFGWPANGSSLTGVKIRTRCVASSSPSSGGSTNVVSVNPNSRAMRCMSASDTPRASVITASGLPPKRTSVNTSQMTNGTRMLMNAPASSAHGAPVSPNHLRNRTTRRPNASSVHRFRLILSAISP